MRIVASGIAALVAAMGCMSANATFIYLHGTAGLDRPDAEAPHASAGTVATAADAQRAAEEQWSDESIDAPQAAARQGWSSPSWAFAAFHGSSVLDRSLVQSDTLAPAPQLQLPVIAAPVTAPVIADIAIPAAPPATIDRTSSTATPSVEQSLTEELINGDVSLVKPDPATEVTQAVPDPSTVGLLGMGLLLAFTATRRSRAARLDVRA